MAAARAAEGRASGAYELPTHGFWWKLFDELGNFVVTLIVVAAYVTSGFALIILAFADRWALPIALAGFAPILGIPGLLLWRRWIDLSKTSQPRLMRWGIIALVGIASLAWLGFLIFVYVQKIDWYTGEPAIALPH